MSRRFDICLTALSPSVNKISLATRSIVSWLQDTFTTRTFMRARVDKPKERMRLGTGGVAMQDETFT